MLNKMRVLLALGSIFSIGAVQAQEGKMELDPAGYVTKYNPEFQGIGPKVYVLPAPRTKEEELTDSYKEKKGFFDSIARQLDYQYLLSDFKHSANVGYLRQNFNPFPSSEQDWNTLIQKLEINNNKVLAAGLANEYALQAIQIGDLNKGIAILIRGINMLQASDLQDEKAIMEYNLANAYLYTGKNTDAIALQENYLKRVLAGKNQADQGIALLAIAMTEAHNKNYRAAENTIIRRAIPLFNKAKAYDGKVQAWIKLARIYQMQNKHTEAQWFLIQARDLARAKNIENDLPEIEYMLGYSKYVQQNYRVAKAELENALALADGENNKVLSLAINDKLGDIYLLMGDFKEAETALQQYWQLRQEVFPHGT